MITDPERIKKLNDKMNNIPHLNLTKFLPTVPLKNMLIDLFQFSDSDFYPYITGFENEQAREHMATNWKGMCIIDTSISGRHNIDYLCTDNNYNSLEFRFDKEGNPIYAPTDVGELCPNIVEYLYQIAESPGKTRISRMVANGGNPSWHSHRLLANGGDEKFVSKDLLKYVLHIPLITNHKTAFGVATKNPINYTDIKRYWQRYQAGEIWIFNSYWYHNAFNMGEYHRDHIMMYVKTDDEKLVPIIEKAVEEYTGPYIKEDILE
jgi:hypothetical protein